MFIQAQHLKFGTASFVSDARNYREPPLRNDCYPIRSHTRIEYAPRFESVAINPCQTFRSAVSHENLALFGYNARSFGKACQCADVPTRVVINHLDLVAGSMGDKDATGLGVEGPMIELRIGAIRHFNDCDEPKRHGNPSEPSARACSPGQ
jgi:hypothetical protein